MDDAFLHYALFLCATFGAALVAGLAGFAFGLVAAAVWLHILSPLQTATLIIAFGLLVQGIAVWKLRHALEWGRLWPLLLGAAFGVPIGVTVLARANVAQVQLGIGVFLVSYGAYGLARPALGPLRRGGATLDAGVGVLNGIVGGVSGFAGIVVTIWSGLRGWPKDVQRAVFQPVGVATFAMTAFWLGAKGAIAPDVLALAAIGLPFLIGGTWLGLRLYGRLDEAGFRRIVLMLLLLSGGVLVIQALRQ
jgi:uncharacterized membrane protein YfcA